MYHTYIYLKATVILAGTNFSGFIASNSDTYQVLLNFRVPSSDEELDCSNLRRQIFKFNCSSRLAPS